MPQDLNNMADESLDSVRGSTEQMANVGRKAGRTAKNIFQRVGKHSKKAGKAAANGVKKAIQTVISVIGKMVAAFPLVFAGILAVVIFFGLFYMYFYEERGSSQNNVLNSNYNNPTYVDKKTGILTADEMTEQQAILDAYYKYLACQSYVKEYGYTEGGVWKTKELTFRGDTEDFAGLSDYYGAESDYYLSPELIMMADEVLHQEQFRWPEHIVAPVNHEWVDYTDADGVHRKIVETTSLRTNDIVDSNLIAQTGLGSVVQYEAGTKDNYVTAQVTSFQVDYDLFIPADPDDPDSHDTYEHLDLVTFYIGENDTAADLQQKIYNKRSSLQSPYLMSGKEVKTSAPSLNLLRQFTGEAEISRTDNGNSVSFTIDHMPLPVDGKDAEVDQTAFNDSTLNSVFGNDANGYYPIKIPLVSSAATFSGNVRYTYVVEPVTIDFRDGTSTKLYDTVDKFSYNLHCRVSGTVEAVAEKDGYEVKVVPVVSSKSPDPRNLDYTREQRDIENGNPWGYEYFDDYVSGYAAKVPAKIMEDGDFYQRVNDEDTLDLLKELGLLVESKGGVVTSDYTDEDLEIVAKVIKHEAGSNKLDELMVGAVFVNRIAHPVYPDTAYDVLMQPGQYGVGSDGTPHILWENIIPSESNYDSARRVLSGEFALPSNVVFQAAFTQGQGTYLVNVNSLTGGAHENTHIYCWYGNSLSATDRFGRSAMSPEEAKKLADDIEADFLAGGTGGTSGVINSDAVYEGKLYAVTSFNAVTATNALHKIAEPKKGLLGKFADMFQSATDFFANLTGNRVLDNDFDLNEEGSIPYSYTPNETDQRRIIYQAITFRDRVKYTDVVADWADREDVFLFIGDANTLSEITIISEVGSTLPGWVSPTAIPSTPISTTAGSSNKGAIMSTLSGETLQALFDGQVTGVSTDSISITYNATNGIVYSSVYRGLSEVSLTNGTYVKTGDTVGKAGEYNGSPGFLFEFKCVTTNSYEMPLNYFYQIVYSGDGSDIVTVALAEASAFRANPAAFDRLKYERWRQGSATGEAWCADFVSWCGWQVYPNSRWPKTAGAGTMKQTAERQGVFEASMAYGGTYTPQPGDVIFFIWDNSGAQVCSHVGLVIGVEGTKVITVEGNASKPANEPAIVYGNGVWRKTYDVTNHQIIGYGRFTSLLGTASE